jgi:transcriptional regulator with XRE-family HTH domain
MPEIPAPERVLRALAPLWSPLYTLLEWATQQTRAYFDAEGTPIDRHLAPSLVRYQAKRQLARLGHDAQEEEGEAYAFQTLPNNGLSLSYRSDLLYALRILKALDGHLPVPGASKARQAFWHQQLIFDYAVPSAAEMRPSLNLLVLWETDAAYTLRRLSLVCPKVGALTRESVAAYWTIEIPHPTVARAQRPPVSRAPAGSTEPWDDLEIRLRRPATMASEPPMINPAHLQQARELRRWTQSALAQQVGVHQSAIAQLETGRVQPSPEVLDAISRSTGFPRAFFTRPSGPAFPFGSLRFRARAAMTARRRRQAWWYAHTLYELVASMAARAELPASHVPRLAGDPVTAAAVTRQAFGLPPDQPIGPLIRTLERGGVGGRHPGAVAPARRLLHLGRGRRLHPGDRGRGHHRR